MNAAIYPTTPWNSVQRKKYQGDNLWAPELPRFFYGQEKQIVPKYHYSEQPEHSHSDILRALPETTLPVLDHGTLISGHMKNVQLVKLSPDGPLEGNDLQGRNVLR